MLEQRISFLAYLAECETLELIDSDASRIFEESSELVPEVTGGEGFTAAAQRTRR
jgi:hypothetical protein